MSRNGIMLPNAAQQQPMVQVAAPLNDVQLVAQLAATIIAHRPELSEADAVAKAGLLVVEAMKQNPNLGRAIQRAQLGE